MKKVLVVFGTRPEAIKMAPLVKELEKRPEFDTVVCVTGQHRQMLDQILNFFDIVPQYDLDIMQEGQTLFDITVKVMLEIKGVLEMERPDIVLVHGDTTTAFAAALAAFYLKIPVGHVEAGLRTNNLYSPYPEEFNRQAIDIISKFYFTPTETSRQNLISENKREDIIFVTGNTVIDAMKYTVMEDYRHDLLNWAKGNRLILLTAHRRENLGVYLENMFCAIKRIVDEFEDIKVIYPVHFNPIVRRTAKNILDNHDRIKLIAPLDVIDFHNFLARSYLVLTDSGGIQEEAPSLGKPVLVMRNTTERPEGIESGTLLLVGTEEEGIYKAVKRLLTDKDMYESMSKAINPYGDGFACKRIADILAQKL